VFRDQVRFNRWAVAFVFWCMAPTIWYATFRVFSAPVAVLYAIGPCDGMPVWAQALIAVYSLGLVFLSTAATWRLWKKVRRSWPFASAQPQQPPRETA
jgi:hypothetical protein